MADSTQSSGSLQPIDLDAANCWKAVLSDVILWVTVFAMLFAVVRLGQWIWLGGFDSTKAQNIHLDFRDASQLTQGSPVHFMGVNVGFVSSVKPSGESVKVAIKTYPNTPKVPKDAVFTIEFNGLAGAKSLEIFPLTEAFHHELDSEPYYWTLDAIHPSRGYWAEEPIRIRDLFKTQTVMAKAMEVAYENIYTTLGQLQSEDEILKNIHTVDNALVKARLDMVDMTRNMAEAQAESHQGVLEISTTLNDVNATVTDIIPYTTTAYYQREILPVFQRGRRFIEQFEQKTRHFNQNELEPTRQTLQRAQQTMVRVKQKATQVQQTITKTHQGLQAAQRGVSRLHQALQRKSAAERLKGVEEKTRQWIEQSDRLNKRL